MNVGCVMKIMMKIMMMIMMIFSKLKYKTIRLSHKANIVVAIAYTFLVFDFKKYLIKNKDDSTYKVLATENILRNLSIKTLTHKTNQLQENISPNDLASYTYKSETILSANFKITLRKINNENILVNSL